MFQFKRKTYKALSDEELVLTYKKANDKLCISLLYERYAHLVMGASLKYLKNVEDAKDMTMQIFESLFDKLIKHEITNFKSWLFIVTRNECFMQLRKTNNTTVKGDELLTQEETDEDNSLLDVKIAHLENKIKELKENQRKCVDLFYIQNHSYQEISDQLKLSLKQVKSEIQNGKRNLKILLEKENEFNH